MPILAYFFIFVSTWATKNTLLYYTGRLDNISLFCGFLISFSARQSRRAAGSGGGWVHKKSPEGSGELWRPSLPCAFKVTHLGRCCTMLLFQSICLCLVFNLGFDPTIRRRVYRRIVFMIFQQGNLQGEDFLHLPFSNHNVPMCS